MSIAIGLVLVLVAALAALQVLGRRMPEAHVAEGSAEVPGSLSDVAARVRDVSAQARWRPTVKQIEILTREGGVVRYRETGGNGVITYVFRELEPDRSFESRIDDEALAFGGRWLITLSGMGTLTRVTIREEGFVKPAIFRVLSKYVFGHDTSLKAYLNDLKTHQARSR